MNYDFGLCSWSMRRAPQRSAAISLDVFVFLVANNTEQTQSWAL